MTKKSEKKPLTFLVQYSLLLHEENDQAGTVNKTMLQNLKQIFVRLKEREIWKAY